VRESLREGAPPRGARWHATAWPIFCRYPPALAVTCRHPVVTRRHPPKVPRLRLDGAQRRGRAGPQIRGGPRGVPLRGCWRLLRSAARDAPPRRRAAPRLLALPCPAPDPLPPSETHSPGPQDRHMLIEREVAAPRGEEARWMSALPQGRAPLVYLYTEVGPQPQQGLGLTPRPGAARAAPEHASCSPSRACPCPCLAQTQSNPGQPLPQTPRSPSASAARSSTSCTAARSCCASSSRACATRATASSCRWGGRGAGRGEDGGWRKGRRLFAHRL
jgi:hypothetical protein